MPGPQSDANISAQREKAAFWCGTAQVVCFCSTGHKDAELVAREGAEEPLYKHYRLRRELPAASKSR